MINAGFSTYIIAVLGAMATLAFGACAAPTTVQHTAVVNNTIYISLSQVFPRAVVDNKTFMVMSYDPQVQVWNRVLSPTVEVEQALQRPLPDVPQECDLHQPQTCYRLAEHSRVERSENGGMTWQIEWQIPRERVSYMKRILKTPWSCQPETLELHMYDFAWLPDGKPYTLVVALGTQGVLVRTTDGTWSRVGVDTARPTPYVAGDPSQLLFTLAPENAVALIMTIVIPPWLLIRGRYRAERSQREGFEVLSLAVAGVLVVCIAWSIFALWAYSIISEYWLALTVSLLILISTIYWCARNVVESED